MAEAGGIERRPWKRWPVALRKPGFVFQSFDLLSRTSAVENAELPLMYSLWRLDLREIRRRAMAAAGRSGAERARATEVLLWACGFSAGVRVFFGFYPARTAAGLNPIDALRCE